MENTNKVERSELFRIIHKSVSFLNLEKSNGEDEYDKNSVCIKIEADSDEHALRFADWLMTNCELYKDQSLWRYESEDYSLEGLLEKFKEQIIYTQGRVRALS